MRRVDVSQWHGNPFVGLVMGASRCWPVFCSGGVAASGRKRADLPAIRHSSAPSAPSAKFSAVERFSTALRPREIAGILHLSGPTSRPGPPRRATGNLAVRFLRGRPMTSAVVRLPTAATRVAGPAAKQQTCRHFVAAAKFSCWGEFFRHPISSPARSAANSAPSPAGQPVARPSFEPALDHRYQRRNEAR